MLFLHIRLPRSAARAAKLRPVGIARVKSDRHRVSGNKNLMAHFCRRCETKMV